MSQARRLQRTIHAGCKQLGLDDDTRRALQLVATGKDSLAAMTETELQQVVQALRQRGFKPGVKPGAKGRYKPAPRADLRMIHALWGALGRAGKLQKPGRDGLNAFLRSRFERTWGAVPIDVDAMTDWTQISAVIDALKDWCRREGVPLK
ncbi:gp16 family protein [Gemmobacter denitrificans]|uniref:Regulatory protein GemA n=1 Tax=Gemmobacter denitrificans TaxID=3123040 RepID=A0ABU8C075_9RHOB